MGPSRSRQLIERTPLPFLAYTSQRTRVPTCVSLLHLCHIPQHLFCLISYTAYIHRAPAPTPQSSKKTATHSTSHFFPYLASELFFFVLDMPCSLPDVHRPGSLLFAHSFSPFWLLWGFASVASHRKIVLLGFPFSAISDVVECFTGSRDRDRGTRNEEGSYTLCARTHVRRWKHRRRRDGSERRYGGRRAGPCTSGPGPDPLVRSRLPRSAPSGGRSCLPGPVVPVRNSTARPRLHAPSRAGRAHTPTHPSSGVRKAKKTQCTGSLYWRGGGLPLPQPRSRRRVEFVGGVGKDGRTRVNGEGLGFLFSVRGAPKGRRGADQEGGRIRERSESEDHSADRDTLGGARTRHVSSPSSGLEPHGGAETRPLWALFSLSARGATSAIRGFCLGACFMTYGMCLD